jgi:hypothetical protein
VASKYLISLVFLIPLFFTQQAKLAPRIVVVQQREVKYKFDLTAAQLQVYFKIGAFRAAHSSSSTMNLQG